MLKILAIGASNSKESINRKFASYTAHQLTGAEVHTVDLNDYPLPIYGIDMENELGIPDNANDFSQLVKNADGLVISLAEHNSNLTSVFKNLTDWMSRIEGKTWRGKYVMLLSTSPGGRGGASALQIALNSFPYSGAQISSSFSLPKFFENFSESGISDNELRVKYLKAVDAFQNDLNK